ncbi:hypothetical protein FB45DRAFT_924331 [Roridomyces roridus]|uniref:DUF7330 domain-containing protein n=1 Tax=Roridomyces roridus TaxID=1738132 RepID=A0AAD7BM64_9AGAR|nr:hypothetical protein FB45DRAFT_924331 [Roridomyces roridus]
MLIPPDSDPKGAPRTDVTVNRAVGQEELPPAYDTPFPQGSSSSPPPFPTASSSSPSPYYPVVPDTVKPTNLLSLSRSTNSVKGTYVIDPRIKIPSTLLPPLTDGETEATRRNMSIQTSTGSINVDVFVVGDGCVKRKCALFLKSPYGSISAKLHAAPVGARPPFTIRAESSNGSITLHLPLSFRGPLTIHTQYGSVRLASSLDAATTTFSEVDGTRRYFVGDFSDYEGEEEGALWFGDEAHLETTYGSVKVQYEAAFNETSESDLGSGKGKGKGSFFGKLLGL